MWLFWALILLICSGRVYYPFFVDLVVFTKEAGKVEDNNFRTRWFKAEIRENHGFRLKRVEDEVGYQIANNYSLLY